MTLRTHESYGQHGLTLADRAGVWLSQLAIRRCLRNRNDLEVLELGCGYRASNLIALKSKLKRGIGVDFQIAPELQTLERFTFHQATIEEVLPKLESRTLDVVMLISVLEHLVDPLFVVQSAWRLLRPPGLLLINVPTWFGKRFLELSAFRLGFSPKLEIDDHKMYYGKRDLWPMLVRSGFKPSQIQLRYHKFGLNLFAAAKKGNFD
ncbi:MAG TPA: methyltransferase domain-containing protein [Pyrinomonadaceae bacterium]|nr:methyltransferase domain-containing protein [Pyrinomonadaceae bacterium]